MLRAAIVFFVVGLIAYVIGANNVAGLSVEVGKILLWVFLALAVVSLVVSLATGRNPPPRSLS